MTCTSRGTVFVPSGSTVWNKAEANRICDNGNTLPNDRHGRPIIHYVTTLRQPPHKVILIDYRTTCDAQNSDDYYHTNMLDAYSIVPVIAHAYRSSIHLLHSIVNRLVLIKLSMQHINPDLS
jgi:hypothetical protein